MKALGFLVCAALALFLIYNAIRHFIINQKSKLIGLLRKVPLLPFPLDGITELEPTEQLKTLVPQARIQVGPEYTSRQECWNGRKHAIDKVNEIMRWIVKYNRKGTEMVDDHEKIEDLIPKETRLVSISMEGFKHGRLCHEFEPIDGMSSGSYYTFQMFGDNKIQVTNYVEEGVSYVAGFCIYIQNPWLSGNHFREKVVEDCFESKKLPIRVRTSRVIVKNEHQVLVQKNPSAPPTKEKNETTYLFSDCQEPSTSYREGSPVPSEVSLEEQTIRYCPKLQRKVMSKVEASVVIHEEWDPQLREMKNKECEMCTDVLNNEYPPPYSSLGVR